MSNAIYKTNQDLPSHMTLGNLLYYSLSDMTISETELLNIFSTNNIPLQYVRKISKADVFRRATSSIKNKSVFIIDPNHPTSTVKAKIEVDELRSDHDGIVRLIGRKVINEHEEEVVYDTVAELVFDRKNESFSYTVTDTSQQRQDFIDLCAEVEDKFALWSQFHTKDTVKNIITKIISDTHPVNLTPSGLCKFVPRVHNDLLESLKGAVKEMEPFCEQAGDINFMETIPVINTEEQQDLIKNASTIEIKNSLFYFTQELKEVLTLKQSLPPRTVASYMSRFKELSAKVKDYEDILGNYLGFLTLQINKAVELVNENQEDTPVYV